MNSRAAFVAVCFVLCIGIAAFAAAPSPDDPKPAWRSGPVKVILTPDEDKAFKALGTDDERAKWIAEFWSKRDPSPGTPANEYKDAFYKRVDEANAKYREAGSGNPGWNTERGRLLLLAGPPDSISGADGNHETWIYTRAVPGKPAPVKVVFENDGESFQLTEGQVLASNLHALAPDALVRFSLGLKEGEVPGAAAAGKPAGGAAAGAAPAAAAAGAAQSPTLAPGVDRLRTAAAAQAPTKDLTIQPAVRYFKAADGSTDVIIGIPVKRTELTGGKPVLYASILASSIPDAKPIELTDQTEFSPADDPAWPATLYGFSISLPARPYELRVAVSDGAEGKIGTAVMPLQLPDYSSDALALSSVTNAASADDAAPDLSADDPFRSGKMRLIPRVDNTLGSKDDLSFFYQVYNAKKDSGQPTLDVAYMIEKKEADGWKKKLRAPIEEKEQHMEFLGYSIPNAALVQWPDGDYRVSITVKDRLANAAANSTVEFSLKK